MNVRFAFSVIALAAFASGCSAPAATDEDTTTPTVDYKTIAVDYPTTKKDSLSDDYHGTTIADPYRWLEDDVAEDTKDWVVRQNKVTNGYLSQIPFREKFAQRLEKIWNFERFGTPFKEGGMYYFFKNDGLQNQSVMYRQKALTDEPEVVLDPNGFSEDGTVALGGISFNKAGDKLAYQVSEGGSDWQTIYVKDLNTGEKMNDKVEWVKFSSASWYKDGFFYCRYPAPKEGDELKGQNTNHMLYYHKLGTPQSADELVYADPKNPKYGFWASVTEDERFLVMGVWESTSGNKLYFKDLTKPNSKFTPIVEDFGSDWNVVDSEGDNLLIHTNHEAGNWRLISIDTNNPSADNWTNILPEGENVLKSASINGGKLIANYMKNAASLIRVFDLSGKKLGEVALPGIGSAGGFSGKKDATEAFYSFNSYVRPSSIYKFDTETMKSEIFKTPTVDFASDDYETKQLWFKSKDGTEVPMFVTHKKGLKLDGQRPTLLYGYGGFDISLQPGFSISRTAILENDGVFVVANIRGGGEFGKEWHMSGTKERKQNVFDDFQAAAKYLISEGYTNSSKLGIEGGSNGGLLVGACITQQPDLYAVAFPRVGVLDMLRYHKFTIGAAWASDYGTSESKEGFDYLIEYSPVHNTKPAAYPATMIMTADHDDRVVPAHSFKFAAALQEAHTGEDPVLIRIETSAGHGAGKPTSKQIEEAADMLAFFFYNTNSPVLY